jgi:hypothetical protein
MNAKNESSFVARRTEALALILLANRADLTVMKLLRRPFQGARVLIAIPGALVFTSKPPARSHA